MNKKQFTEWFQKEAYKYVIGKLDSLEKFISSDPYFKISPLREKGGARLLNIFAAHLFNTIHVKTYNFDIAEAIEKGIYKVSELIEKVYDLYWDKITNFRFKIVKIEKEYYVYNYDIGRETWDYLKCFDSDTCAKSYVRKYCEEQEESEIVFDNKKE
jgi:hypothetical protein